LKPALRMALMGLGVAVAGVVVISAWSRIIERQETLEEIGRLRDDLYRARIAADRCRGSLQTSEASLRDLGLTVDSMRRRIDSFEALDRRGVPVEQYPEYLRLFESYNDSVSIWEERERRLRLAESACRETIQEHNVISDSLQSVLTEAGIDTGSGATGSVP
jgi:hypothetical protein